MQHRGGAERGHDWAPAGGEGPPLLQGEWKLSRSQIPSYQRGHGGGALISFF